MISWRMRMRSLRLQTRGRASDAHTTVIPAKAGIHLLLTVAPREQNVPGFRRDDDAAHW
jgi:hypothetical protein